MVRASSTSGRVKASCVSPVIRDVSICLNDSKAIVSSFIGRVANCEIIIAINNELGSQIIISYKRFMIIGSYNIAILRFRNIEKKFFFFQNIIISQLLYISCHTGCLF